MLGVENGSVKRDAWEAEFGTVVSILDLGERAGPYANMVLIPAGDFQMRTNSDGDDEEPQYTTVYVDAFYIDKYKVTNAQYKEFLNANPEWRKEVHNNIDSRL